LAVKEANILGIPIIALVDTNCDPDPIDHIIPSNDDAIRAIKLMLTTMASAALDGQAILHTLEAEKEEAAEMEGEETMERYLGPSTLAKLQAEAEAAQMVDGEDDEVDSEEDEIEVETATADEIEADVTTADEQTEEDKVAEVETPEAMSVEAEASTAEEEDSPEVVTDTENSDEEIVTTETAKEIESEKI
jgi:hypothetical protein